MNLWKKIKAFYFMSNVEVAKNEADFFAMRLKDLRDDLRRERRTHEKNVVVILEEIRETERRMYAAQDRHEG